MAFIPVIAAATAASQEENREPMDTDSRMVVLGISTLLLLAGVGVLLFSSMGLQLQPLIIEIKPQMIIFFIIAWAGIAVVVIKLVMIRQRRQQQMRQNQQYYHEEY